MSCKYFGTDCPIHSPPPPRRPSQSLLVTSLLQAAAYTSGIVCGLDWLLCDTWSYVRTGTSQFFDIFSFPTPSTASSWHIFTEWMNEWTTEARKKSLGFCEPQSSTETSIPRRWCEGAAPPACFPEDNFSDVVSKHKAQEELPCSWYRWIKSTLTHPSSTHSFSWGLLCTYCVPGRGLDTEV